MEKAQPKQLKGFRIVKKIIENEFTQHLIASKLLFNLTDKVAVASKLCIDCLKNGGKILIFGNGGSAADSQHIAAEVVGRFKKERRGLPAIALTTDSSIFFTNFSSLSKADPAITLQIFFAGQPILISII